MILQEEQTQEQTVLHLADQSNWRRDRWKHNLETTKTKAQQQRNQYWCSIYCTGITKFLPKYTPCKTPGERKKPLVPSTDRLQKMAFYVPAHVASFEWAATRHCKTPGERSAPLWQTMSTFWKGPSPSIIQSFDKPPAKRSRPEK